MFSYIRLISMLRECKDPATKTLIGQYRDTIYQLASKEKRQHGIKEYLNVNREDHVKVVNEVGQRYLESLDHSPLINSILTGSSIDGVREQQIANGDFSFTHDDSAASVFADLGKVQYLSGWQQSNILRYVTVANALIDHRVKNSKDQVVVDIGCSEGSFLKFWYANMQQPGKQKLIYTGIEVLESSLEKAKARFGKKENVSFIQADMMKSRLKKLHPNSADAVLLLEVIEHVGLKSARDLLKDAHSILNKDGIVCVSSPNPQKHLGQQFVWVDNHLYEFSLEEMKSELRDAGFEVVSVSGWYADLPTLKREFTDSQKVIYEQFKLLGPQMATSLMAHLMPEFAKHYTIVAKKV